MRSGCWGASGIGQGRFQRQAICPTSSAIMATDGVTAMPAKLKLVAVQCVTPDRLSQMQLLAQPVTAGQQSQSTSSIEYNVKSGPSQKVGSSHASKNHAYLETNQF